MSGPTLRAAGTRIHQRMRRAPIVMARLEIVVPDIVAVAFVARGKEIARRSHRGDTYVEVVGRAPEHPASEVRPRLHHASTLAHVLDALRNHERHAGAAAIVGAKRHRLRMLHLHVVERGDRTRAVRKRRMRGDVAGACRRRSRFPHRAFSATTGNCCPIERPSQMTSLSSGKRFRIRSAASAGAMYGGRAGPISIPVATDAVTLVVPR